VGRKYPQGTFAFVVAAGFSLRREMINRNVGKIILPKGHWILAWKILFHETQDKSCGYHFKKGKYF